MGKLKGKGKNEQGKVIPWNVHYSSQKPLSQTVGLFPRKAPQLFTGSLRLEGTQELRIILDVPLQQVGNLVLSSGSGSHRNASVSKNSSSGCCKCLPMEQSSSLCLSPHLLELSSDSEGLKLKSKQKHQCRAGQGPAGAGLYHSLQHILHRVHLAA